MQTSAGFMAGGHTSGPVSPPTRASEAAAPARLRRPRRRGPGRRPAGRAPRARPSEHAPRAARPASTARRTSAAMRSGVMSPWSSSGTTPPAGEQVDQRHVGHLQHQPSHQVGDERHAVDDHQGALHQPRLQRRRPRGHHRRVAGAHHLGGASVHQDGVERRCPRSGDVDLLAVERGSHGDDDLEPGRSGASCFAALHHGRAACGGSHSSGCRAAGRAWGRPRQSPSALAEAPRRWRARAPAPPRGCPRSGRARRPRGRSPPRRGGCRASGPRRGRSCRTRPRRQAQIIGADVVGHRDAQRLELPREPQVEVGDVHEDGAAGPALGGGAGQRPEDPPGCEAAGAGPR